jgi:hypothetical protein
LIILTGRSIINIMIKRTKHQYCQPIYKWKYWDDCYNNFLRISIVIINIVIVLFINLLLLQCNYAVVGKVFRGETSKYRYTY